MQEQYNSNHHNQVPLKVPAPVVSTTPTCSSIIPIRLAKSRLEYSPANSATHSSSISSLGLVDNRLDTHISNDSNIMDNSSNSSSDQDEDEQDLDINMIRNDNSKFDKSNILRRSFDEVFKMDNLASPITNKFKLISYTDSGSQHQILTPTSSPSSSQRNSPNIFFKKFMSKSALKPQSRSFKRVTKELLQESQPFQAEIDNEAAVTLLLKDEELILEKGAFSTNDNLMKFENLKKYELINRANKLWSHAHSVNRNNGLDQDTDHSSRKRKSIDINNNKVIDHSSNKRRVVSTSPNLNGSTSPLIPVSRRNSKLMQSTSDDLEKMSI